MGKEDKTMAHVCDVAAFILEERGTMTAMKLQKLVYYSQAWSLVWDEEPLFEETIQAWANGPVAPALYAHHRGKFSVSPGEIGGSPDKLSSDQRDTVAAVLRYYGDLTAQQLSDLTHAEAPWNKARGDLGPGAASSAEITLDMMAEYYGTLPADG
jgi:uncharacterized phage-associated protein